VKSPFIWLLTSLSLSLPSLSPYHSQLTGTQVEDKDEYDSDKTRCTNNIGVPMV